MNKGLAAGGIARIAINTCGAYLWVARTKPEGDDGWGSNEAGYVKSEAGGTNPLHDTDAQGGVVSRVPATRMD